MESLFLSRYSPPSQLMLDLGIEEVSIIKQQDNCIKRSVVFPKNIQVFDVPEFQQRVSKLFAPLNIRIEFRLTRQNRLEMCWLFPKEVIQYNQEKEHRLSEISAEESAAFETLVLSFAGSSH